MRKLILFLAAVSLVLFGEKALCYETILSVEPESFNSFRYEEMRVEGPIKLSIRTGRFLSVDPGKDWDPHKPQSWNMYAYVRNNPINSVDPTGRCTDSIVCVHYGGVEASEEITVTATPLPQEGTWANAVYNQKAGQEQLIADARANYEETLRSDRPLEPVSPEMLIALPAAGALLRSAVRGTITELATAESAQNVANGARLAAQLRLESANSAFTATGELSEGAIASSRQIIPAGSIGNAAVPNGFAKYATETFASPSGPFQAHFTSI